MQRKHFTLIEMIVVGGVLSMAMLLPALSAARERARSASCISNLKQISLAELLYANDNSAYRAAPANFNGEYIGNDIDAVGTQSVNRKFYGNYPTGKFILQGYTGNSSNAITVDNKKLFSCPSDASYDENASKISYYDAIFEKSAKKIYSRYRLDNAEKPSKAVIWFDQHVNLGHNNSNHPIMVNAAFLDGHVSSRPLPSGMRYSVESQNSDGWQVLDYQE